MINWINNSVDDNKRCFIERLRVIEREGIEDLIKFLEDSDFFTAPASPKLFYAKEGGLCAHALARYDILMNIIKVNGWYIDPQTAAIVGLLSSINKVSYFEEVIMNKKVYRPTGTKKDELGNFSWVSEKGYKVKDAEDRFVFGTSGQNAERLITNYIPLRDEESVAIVNLGVSFENPTFYFGAIYKKYSLACLLNAADSLATFCTEGMSTVELPF